GIDNDVDVDHVGVVGAGRRIDRAGRRVGLERRRRRNLLVGGLIDTFEARYLGYIAVGVGGRVETCAGRRADRIARRPDESVGLGRIDLALGVVSRAKGDAAGGAGANVRRAFVPAIVEPDIIAADRLPDARAVELVTQHSRLMRIGEGVLGRQ